MNEHLHSGVVQVGVAFLAAWAGFFLLKGVIIGLTGTRYENVAVILAGTLPTAPTGNVQ